MPRMGSKLDDPQAARVAFGHEIKAIKAAAKAAGRAETAEESERIRLLGVLAGEASDQMLCKQVEDLFGSWPSSSAPRRGARGFGSWGESVVKAASDNLGRFKDLAPSGGAPVTVPVNPDPIRQGEPLTSMRQLIDTQPNTTGHFAYLRQTARQNAAAAVAAGDVKPTSKYSTERIDDTTRVVAHLSEPIDRSTLSDAPLLERFVNDEMQLGLDVEIERLILRGTGRGAEFAGLENTSGIQVQPWIENLLTTTRTAITKLEMFSLPPTGWVLNPLDWAAIEMSSNSFGYAMTQAGQALPVERAARRLWGLPVAVSAAAPSGTGWLANWDDLTLHVREDAVITWSEAMYRQLEGNAGGATDFARNLVAFRCEARVGLAIHRPMGAVQLDLKAPVTP